jgi:hypothetical protein
MEGRDLNMGESERVSVTQAAKELGMSPMAVRVRMERGLLDIGEVYPSVSGKKDRSSYYIYRSRLNKVLGKEG